MKKAAFPTLITAALAAGWVAGTLLPVPSLRHAGTGSPPPLSSSPATLQTDASDAQAALPRWLPAFASVPDVRQSTGYTCGAAALQAVLAYWGTEEREDRLAARLCSSPDSGTHPDDIVRVARDLGLAAELREGLDLADLEAALAAGTTVIVDLQAWRDTAGLPWAETWDDGHYMVLLGMDGESLYFEDPSLLGARGTIPRSEFVERWHDYEGEPPLDLSDRRYVRMAIFIRGEGRALAAPPAFRRVR
jgi:hypothetical protein